MRIGGRWLWVFVACSALSVGILSGCGASEGGGNQAKVGFAFSQTGAASVYGSTQKNGAQLAVDEVNKQAGDDGIKINPLFEDTGSDPQEGVNVFQRFINSEQVDTIVGPTLSNTAKTTDPIAQQEGVPVLGVSNTASGITEIGDYIFRDSLTEAQVIPNMIQTVQDELGVEKVALIYGDDDAFTVAGYEVFKEALEEQGIEITSAQTFAKGDRDFSAQLTEIRSQEPDAILVSALAEEASGIISQARQLGIPEDVRIIGGNGFNSPSLIENAGEAAEGVIVGAAWNASADTPQNQQFIKAYRDKYDEEPDQFAAQAYAGVKIVNEAIKNAGSTERDALRDALTEIEGLDTVLGEFSF